MLSPKQEAFCLAYAASGNASEAYRQAGYKTTNEAATRASASRLLTNANVEKRIAELVKEVRTSKIADVKERQEILTAILRGELEEEVIVTEGGDGYSEAVTKTKKPSFAVRIKAAEVLGRIQGDFKEGNSLVGVIPVVIGGENAIPE